MDKKVKAKSGTQTYTGNVKITLLNGSKPYKVIQRHNYGTAAFFDYIWRRVRGDNLNTKVPAYIFPLDISHNRLTNYGVVTEGTPEITTNDSVADRDDKSTITYIFLIPGTIVQNRTVQGFELVSLDRDSSYAILDLPGDEGITIQNSKTNILVEWSLILTNGDVI